MNLPYAVWRRFSEKDIPHTFESAETIISAAAEARKNGLFTPKEVQSIRASVQRALRSLEGDRRVLQWRVSHATDPREEGLRNRLRETFERSLRQTEEFHALLEAIAPGTRDRTAKRRKNTVLAALNDIIPS